MKGPCPLRPHFTGEGGEEGVRVTSVRGIKVCVCVSQVTCRGQRTTMDADPHLPPCLRQGLLLTAL